MVILAAKLRIFENKTALLRRKSSPPAFFGVKA
jgi:hypothetical protein